MEYQGSLGKHRSADSRGRQQVMRKVRGEAVSSREVRDRNPNSSKTEYSRLAFSLWTLEEKI